MKLKALAVACMMLFGCKSPSSNFEGSPTSEWVSTTTTAGVATVLPVEVLDVKPTKEHLKELVIDETRMIVLKGPIDDPSAEVFIAKLIELEQADAKTPITVVIRSGGGSVVAGFRMIAAMKATKPTLTCVVDESAYSMAAAIFLHCDNKYVQEYAGLMFHEGSLGVEGDKQIVRQRLAHFIKLMDLLNKDVATQLNMPLPEYMEKVEYEWWLTAEDAVFYGAADQIVDGLKYSYKEPLISPFTFPF